MAEVFEAEDSDLAAGLGIMEGCSSNERDAPNTSHLGTGDHGPKDQPKQITISPGKRA